VTALTETRPHELDRRLVALRPMAIVPALDEEASIGRVIDEIRAAAPAFEVIVVDDGSTDRTAAIAMERGADVLRLPCNIGIGGAVQTGYKLALRRGSRFVVQIDGDGQHDPGQVAALVRPILDGEADIVIGSRFAERGRYRSPIPRRLGIRIFRALVSLLVRQRLTDTSSSFRALNGRALALFGADYPHGYLETVEATVLASRHKLRIKEVPVTMRHRVGGRSSLTVPLSVFYAFKVIVAVLVGYFRRPRFDWKEEL
jgi:glycosyltransferase involved in cell wall biosynthesis